MATCPACDAQVQDGTRFCTSCGAPIADATPGDAAGDDEQFEAVDASAPLVDAEGRSTRAAIEAVAKAQMSVKFGVGREIRMLNEQLHPGEEVLQLAKANHRGKSGVLAVTNERVVWYHAAMVGRTVIDQRLDRISSVKAHKSLAGAGLVVNAGGDEWSLHAIFPKEAVDRIAGTIRAEAQAKQAPAPPPAAPAEPQTDVFEALRKLGELRDAGIVTPEEFEAKKAERLRRV